MRPIRWPWPVALGVYSIACLQPSYPAATETRSREPGGVSFEVVASEARTKATLAPLSLTASDGTGLELVEFRGRGVLEGPLAFTELHLRFKNPEDRVREGRFRIRLPDNASISRFAMKIGTRWQEGQVVERQRARQVYEDFLHRRQDPALLEQSAGNEFVARVFPIPAKAEKELVVSYSQELASRRDVYRLPLVGLPRLQALDIEIQLESAAKGPLQREVRRYRKTDWKPDADFELKAAPSLHGGLRHDNLVLVRAAPHIRDEAQPVQGLTVLVDTSASRALNFDDQKRLVRALTNGLAKGAGPGTPLRVLAFDQGTALIYEGDAGGFGASGEAKLETRGALGATDFAQAFRWVSRHAQGQKYDRLLVVSDGVMTAEDRHRALQEARSLAKLGFTRLDALALGGLRDGESLHALTTDALPRAGVVMDGATPIEAIARRLNRSVASRLPVTVDGARWVWPRTVSGLQPQDEVLVYADLPPGLNAKVQVGGQPAETVGLSGGEKLVGAPKRLLERAWVKARIAHLLDEHGAVDPADRDLRRALRDRVVALSTQHRVLSPFTALLVLETTEDYRRYRLSPTAAAAEILTVGPTGIVPLSQSKLTEPLALEHKGQQMKAADRSRRRARSPIRLSASRLMGRGPEDGRSVEEADFEEARAVPGLRGTVMADAGGVGGLGQISGIGRGGGGGRLGGAAGRGAQALALEASVSAPPPRARLDPRAGLDEDDAAPMVDHAPEDPPADGEAFAERAEGLTMPPEASGPPALGGTFAEVRGLLLKKKVKAAESRARRWRSDNYGDVLAVVALGEVLEASGQLDEAARAYGSIIDLYPARADMLRFAAALLERLESEAARTLAVDAYRKAVEQRPDHPSGHRGLAFALLKQGKLQEAFDALEIGLNQNYPERFPGLKRILRDDLGLLAAVWTARTPAGSKAIAERLRKAGGREASGPSTRFVLTWETDANDVDLHIHDAKGGHAWYRQRELPSGGELYADVTSGYGPECFTIPAEANAYPYRLRAHYYRKGPMGYGMGRVQILHHNGEGRLQSREKPFVVMNDGAYVHLATVETPQAFDGGSGAATP